MDQAQLIGIALGLGTLAVFMIVVFIMGTVRFYSS